MNSMYRAGSIAACALVLTSLSLFDPGACNTILPVQAATKWAINYHTIPRGETPAFEHKMSAGCISCHGETDAPTMHTDPTVIIGCADCHGGDPSVMKVGAPGSAQYLQA